jgi:hypothetical protein
MKTLSLSDAVRGQDEVEWAGRGGERIGRGNCYHKERLSCRSLISADEFESLKETLVVRSDATLMDEIRKGLKL